MTSTRVIKGQKYANLAALQLINLSAWFELTPYPDDEWRFVVKAEHAPVRVLVNLPGRAP